MSIIFVKSCLFHLPPNQPLRQCSYTQKKKKGIPWGESAHTHRMKAGTHYLHVFILLAVNDRQLCGKESKCCTPVWQLTRGAFHTHSITSQKIHRILIQCNQIAITSARAHCRGFIEIFYHLFDAPTSEQLHVNSSCRGRDPHFFRGTTLLQELLLKRHATVHHKDNVVSPQKR